MRELERTAADTSTHAPALAAGTLRIGIVRAGRVGTALARALRAAGHEVDGPAGRGEIPGGEAILLCAPVGEIGRAAGAVAAPARFVGHPIAATRRTTPRPARAGCSDRSSAPPWRTGSPLDRARRSPGR